MRYYNFINFNFYKNIKYNIHNSFIIEINNFLKKIEIIQKKKSNNKIKSITMYNNIKIKKEVI